VLTSQGFGEVVGFFGAAGGFGFEEFCEVFGHARFDNFAFGKAGGGGGALNVSDGFELHG
jgi:hypothetical protein